MTTIYKLSDIELNDRRINELQSLYLLLNNNLSKNLKEGFEGLKNNIYIAIVNDIIVGCITLILEKKIIHNGMYVGHIEDVIVLQDYQHNGVGYKLVNYIINLCKNNNCYKVILDCSEELIKFYKKNNMEKKNIQMAIYF